MAPAVLSELRLLTSAKLNSYILLTVVLAGDARLVERLRSDEFLPLDSRIRVPHVTGCTKSEADPSFVQPDTSGLNGSAVRLRRAAAVGPCRLR